MGWGLGLALVRRGDRVLVGHDGAMPGFVAGLLVQRAERTGASVLTKHGRRCRATRARVRSCGGRSRCAAPDCRARVPAAVPSELDGMLGQWWTEGSEIVLSLRGGRFRVDLTEGPPGATCPTSSLRPRRWRVVEGRERGELLRAVRGEDGAVEKLYLATYPLRARLRPSAEPQPRSQMSPATKNIAATPMQATIRTRAKPRRLPAADRRHHHARARSRTLRPTLRKPSASGSMSQESSTTAGIRNIATCADEEARSRPRA